METLHEQPEIGKSFATRLSLDDIIFDSDIYPRAKIDDFTEEKYCNDLFHGISFPCPKVEQIGESIYRVTDGVHTVKAHQRRRDMYRVQDAGERTDDPLPAICEEELNTMLCSIEEIPEDEDRMLRYARHNMKHGKALSSDDYRKIARHLYTKWFGAPVTKVAGELGIKWETVKGYVADMVADYGRHRAELILQLDAEGKTQEEIGRLGLEMYPYGTGWSQETISKFLAEHRNSGTEKGSKKNGPSKILAFRTPSPVTNRVFSQADNGNASEKTAGPSGSEEKTKGLELIKCEQSVMTTGLDLLHHDIRETYLRVIAKLNAVTWSKELRLRERLGKAPH